MTRQYAIITDITGYDIELPGVRLWRNGILSFYPGFGWNGPSDPAIDTPNSMRTTVIHDAFYRFMQAGLLPNTDEIFSLADDLLETIGIEDGMTEIRASVWNETVEHFGHGHADPKNQPEELRAP